MLRRKYRCIIDIEVSLDEVSAEAIERRRRRYLENSDDLEPLERNVPTENELRHQRALQDQLTKMPDIFDAWLLHSVVLDLQHGSPFQAVKFDYVEEEELLRPVIENLAPASRHWFREASARGDLIEKAEELYDLVESKVVGVRIEEVDKGLC